MELFFLLLVFIEEYYRIIVMKINMFEIDIFGNSDDYIK